MWSSKKAILTGTVIFAGSAVVCPVGTCRTDASAMNNSVRTSEQTTLDSSDVVISSYTMDVDIFPQRYLLKVKAVLALTSKKPGVGQLCLRLRNEFRVEKITQADKNLQFSQDDWDVTVQGVHVAQNSPPLIWEYKGTFKPPFESDSMSDVILYSDEIRLTHSSHWYPELIRSSELAVRPSSRLSVEVPEGFTVVSGARQEHPPRRRNGRILYQYASRTNGSLSFAAAQYARTAIPWEGKTIEAYFFPKKPGQKPKVVTKLPHREKDVLENLKIVKNILDFYSGRFGPYPWGRFALVQKSNHAAYAYGVQTYVVMNNLSRRHEKNLAHEIAHQWWGNLIDFVGQGERWLTESLAEYSAFLYVEHAHGSRRVVGDKRDFLLSQMHNMHPIRKASFNTPDYGNIIYKIGPHIFHMLRYVVGDEQFFGTLKTFTAKYANKDATVDDFIEAAEGVHKESLDWFFSQWLDRTKNPAFVLESESTQQNNNTFLVEGAITQHHTKYRMPLEIEITGKDQKEKRCIWVQGPTTRFEHRVPYKPSQVTFAKDMTFWVLADFFHSEQERLAALEKRPKPQSWGSSEELLRLIRDKIAKRQAYNLGTEIELVLATDQAVRLDCADNPYGYKEILICPMEGNMFMYTFYTDGSSSGGGRSLASGHSSRARSTVAMDIAVWEIKDDKVCIKFRAETDKEKIKQEYKRIYERKGMTPEEIEQRLRQLFPQ